MQVLRCHLFKDPFSDTYTLPHSGVLALPGAPQPCVFILIILLTTLNRHLLTYLSPALSPMLVCHRLDQCFKKLIIQRNGVREVKSSQGSELITLSYLEIICFVKRTNFMKCPPEAQKVTISRLSGLQSDRGILRTCSH